MQVSGPGWAQASVQAWVQGLVLALVQGGIVRRIADRAPGYNGYRVAQGNGSLEPLTLTQPGQTIQLGETEYFALGDNTENSRDGRYYPQ